MTRRIISKLLACENHLEHLLLRIVEQIRQVLHSTARAQLENGASLAWLNGVLVHLQQLLSNLREDQVLHCLRLPGSS